MRAALVIALAVLAWPPLALAHEAAQTSSGCRRSGRRPTSR